MALKAGWIKRYLSSTAKWTAFPDHFEFGGVCTYGENYIDRIYEITDNPFWKDVLDSIKYLWKEDRMIIPENRLLTPIKRLWKEKGIYTVSDVLDRNRCTLKLVDFEKNLQYKYKFLRIWNLLFKDHKLPKLERYC